MASAARNSLEINALPRQFLFIALVLGLPFGIASTPWIFRDGDTSWQVAAGKWILAHKSIPTVDPFSYTAAGHPWVAMEWLAEVLYAGAYQLGGFAGLATVVAAALIAVHAIVFFFLEKRVSLPALAATLVMMDFVLAPFVLARPHVLAWPLISAWTALLLKADEKSRPPPLWTTFLLVLWTNVHASFPLAIVIAAAIGFDALVAARWTTIREWALFGLASLLALCTNANGIAGVLQPFRTLNLSMLTLIAEWHRSTLHATPFFFAVMAIAVGAGLWSKARVPLGRLLLLAFLVTMALAHVRHQAVLAIVAACVLPPIWCSRAWSHATVPKWLMLGTVPMLAFEASRPWDLPESESTPARLIAAVPADLKGQPVFNGYIFGGPLILAGIRPYIDGRAEIYGDDFVHQYVNITNGDTAALDSAVKRYGITWAIVPNSDERLVRAMESTRAWYRIYSDRVGVIEMRAHRPTASTLRE